MTSAVVLLTAPLGQGGISGPLINPSVSVIRMRGEADERTAVREEWGEEGRDGRYLK